MRKLSVFIFVSLDGYYKGLNEDISWHRHGAEENQYAADMLEAEHILLFGRKTYEMMAGYWPSEMALQNDPEVAQGMNSAQKIVFSSSLQKASWENTTVMNGDLVSEIENLKAQPGPQLHLLGSGILLTQLAAAGLIDEYQIMTDPVAIGQGTSIFEGLSQPLNLQLQSSRTFGSGTVLNVYR